MNSQEAYSEWKSAIQLRESLEADYLAALRSRDWPRIFEIRHYWLAEARDYCTEALKLYRRARRAEKAEKGHNGTSQGRKNHRRVAR